MRFSFNLLMLLSLSAFAEPKPATVLLITDDSLEAAWQPFAEWKTRLGKPTKIITIQKIAETYKGADIQQKIRACCLDHVDRRQTRWVVLGGDSQPNGKGLVPDRDTRHMLSRPTYADLPTDLYYLSEKTWDANKDGVYGDWKADREAVSYTNEKASIGRIPVRTPADIMAYTDKVIAYESNYPEKNFGQNMVYTCPEAGAYPKLNTSKDTLDEAWEAGEITQFFTNRRNPERPLSPKNWVGMINAKDTAKVHMHGHGLLPVWVLEQGRKVSAKHVAQLNNKNAYLTMTTVSCFTGHYDGEKDPSITESMLRAPEAGAVIVIAPSREGVPVFHNPREDFRLMVTEGKMDGTTTTMTLFWKHALTKNLTAGEALRAVKKELADDAMKTPSFHFAQCELNLLGDPTLDLRAKDPVTPKLVLPKSLSKGKQTLELELGTPGASLCLWKGDDVYEVVEADKDGKVSATFETRTSGELLVTATGPSLNAALGKVQIK